MIRLILLSLLLTAHTVSAASLQGLMEQDQLRLKTWLEPAEDIVVGQEVRLVVEVATQRWFAGGTRIRQPEVPNLVILQRDNFATNLSRQESGQTWVVQQWRLELYPQAAGVFTIPPLSLELAVNDASAGIVRGQLKTSALAFDAQIPALMSTAATWLAAPQFSVEQSFDRELLDLGPGDAFTRTITLRATQLNSMMLPAFQSAALAGLASYPANPQLQDRSNRGAASASRIEEITYVVEKAGQYQLPEKNYYWWNTAKRSAEIVTLPAVSIDAGVTIAPKVNPVAGNTVPSFELRWLLLLLLPVLLLAWYRIYRRRVAADLLGAAQRALKRGQGLQGLALIYRWLNRERPQPNWLSLRLTARYMDEKLSGQAIEKLMRSVYGCPCEAEQNQCAQPTELPLNALRAHRSRHWWARLRKPVELSINPGSSAGEQKASG